MAAATPLYAGRGDGRTRRGGERQRSPADPMRRLTRFTRSTAAAAQSTMPLIAPLPQTTFTTGDAARCGAPAPLPNLHQLDGRDQGGCRRQLDGAVTCGLRCG